MFTHYSKPFFLKFLFLFISTVKIAAWFNLENASPKQNISNKTTEYQHRI